MTGRAPRARGPWATTPDNSGGVALSLEISKLAGDSVGVPEGRPLGSVFRNLDFLFKQAVSPPSSLAVEVDAAGEIEARRHAGARQWLDTRRQASRELANALRDDDGRLMRVDDRLLARLANCCRGLGQVAEIDRVEGPDGWRSRLHAVWSCEDLRCLRCGAGERSKRALILSQAAEQWVAEGGRLYLVSMTYRHRRVVDSSDLGAQYGTVSLAWSYAIGELRRHTPGWRQIHYVRVIEETVSDRGGWHVHVHAVLFVPSGTGFDARRARANLGSLWSRKIVELLGDGAKPGRHGVDVKPWVPNRSAYGGAGGVGAYLWGLGSEIHGASPRQRLKRGHAPDSGGHAPGLGVMDDGRVGGVPVWVRVEQGHVDEWLMWCRATAGRRLQQGSQGVKTFLAGLARAFVEAHPAEVAPDERTEPVATIGGPLLEWLQSEPERWIGFRRSCDSGASRCAQWMERAAVPERLSGYIHVWLDIGLAADRALECDFIPDRARDRLVTMWRARSAARLDLQVHQHETETTTAQETAL